MVVPVQVEVVETRSMVERTLCGGGGGGYGFQDERSNYSVYYRYSTRRVPLARYVLSTVTAWATLLVAPRQQTTSHPCEREIQEHGKGTMAKTKYVAICLSFFVG